MSDETKALARVGSSAMQPTNMDELWNLARDAAAIGLCGHKDTESAYICMLAGIECGLSAIQSLRGFNVIKGNPSPSADMMVALARRSESCEHMRVVTLTETECVYEAKRKGQPAQRVSFTIADAKQAGLLSNTNWAKYPKDMLRARAGARAARMEFPEVVFGLYIPEELESIDAGEAEIVASGSGPSVSVEAEIVDTVTDQFDVLINAAVMDGGSLFASYPSPDVVVELFKSALASLMGVDGWHAIQPRNREMMLHRMQNVPEDDRARSIADTIAKAGGAAAEGDDRGHANRTFHVQLGDALNGDSDAVAAYKAARREALGVESFADLSASQLNAEIEHIADGSSEVWREFTASHFGDEPDDTQGDWTDEDLPI